LTFFRSYVSGKAGASVANQREEGFISVINKHPGIKVLAKMANEHQRAEGLTIMEDLLQAHPKIDAAYCINDEVALGAVGAIEAAKRKGILVTGIDANRDAIQGGWKGCRLEKDGLADRDFRHQRP